ncbi:MAG: DUF3810 domain-containing protein [Lachnospiraceae bacterium]|jgi:hypothetical protein|nr:DUF3810 domain-containing protein [Lachnospiraceae bacterium]
MNAENFEKKHERPGKHRKAGLAIPAVISFAALLLNLAARFSRDFSDRYTERIFPLWEESYGRLTGSVPFSVGELLLVVGVIWIAAAAAILVTDAVFCLRRKHPPCVSFLKATVWMLSIVLMVMTLNCYIPWQAEGLSYGAAEDTESATARYSQKQLTSLRDYIVRQADSYAAAVKRDGDGNAVFSADRKQEAVACMKKLSEQFPRLSGYYPEPKGLFFSGLMSQMHMQGYYFPFSMEANYNTKMCEMNMPFTFCHELSHLKGYMKEDDCNMLAFLACMGSDDPAFVYSGYLGVLNYVDNDFYTSIGKDKAVYRSHVLISDQVISDNRFLSDEAWKEVEKNSVIDTETATRTTKNFTDAQIRANGISEGWNSYDLVVRQLLDWYYDRESREGVQARN